jgi:hypothetical protein
MMAVTLDVRPVGRNGGAMVDVGEKNEARLRVFEEVGAWSKRPLVERQRRWNEMAKLKAKGMSLRGIAAHMTTKYGTPMTGERVRQTLADACTTCHGIRAVASDPTRCASFLKDGKSVMEDGKIVRADTPGAVPCGGTMASSRPRANPGHVRAVRDRKADKLREKVTRWSARPATPKAAAKAAEYARRLQEVLEPTKA